MLASLLLALLPGQDERIVPATELPRGPEPRSTVAPQHPIEVRVLTPDAEPAIGVEVRLLNRADGPTPKALRDLRARSLGDWAEVDLAGIDPVATTDREGRARLADLQPDRWLVVTDGEIHRVLDGASYSGKWFTSLVLEPRREVLVTVADRRENVLKDLPLSLEQAGAALAYGTTNELGQALLSWRPESTSGTAGLAIRPVGIGYEDIALPLSFTSAALALQLDAPAGWTLKPDAASRPRLRSFLVEFEESPGGLDTFRSNADREINLYPVRPGLALSARSYRGAWIASGHVAAGLYPLGIEVNLPGLAPGEHRVHELVGLAGPSQVNLRVLDERGSPLAQRELSASLRWIHTTPFLVPAQPDHREHQLGHVRTDAEGMLSIELPLTRVPMDYGVLRLEEYSTGHCLQAGLLGDVTVRFDGTPTDLGEARLRPPGTVVAGRVVDASGQALGNLYVEVRETPWGSRVAGNRGEEPHGALFSRTRVLPGGRLRTDANGAFELTGALPTGPLSLLVTDTPVQPFFATNPHVIEDLAPGTAGLRVVY